MQFLLSNTSQLEKKQLYYDKISRNIFFSWALQHHAVTVADTCFPETNRQDMEQCFYPLGEQDVTGKKFENDTNKG